jgi:phage terminase large subunit-like protein
MATDLPLLDDTVTQLPSDDLHNMAELGRSSLYFLAKAILRYRDMTDRFHGRCAEWYDRCRTQFKQILWPRDHYKTSLITIAGTVQRVVRDVNRTSLICNESATNSELMLRAIRLHAESNRVFRAVYSDIIPRDIKRVRWNDQMLDFERSLISPSPTIDTIGMTGAVVSRHYHHITFDDPVGEEAAASQKVMDDTIRRMSGLTALLVKPEVDTVDYVGTPWLMHDTVSWFARTFESRLAKLIIPVMVDGEIVFPELITPEMLAIKRKALGEYRFSCWYLLKPRDSEKQNLNVQDIRFWDWSDASESAINLLNPSGEVIDVWSTSQLDITTTVDLAAAEKASSDRNAIVTVGVSPKGQAIVLDTFVKLCTPIEVIDHLFWLAKRYTPRSFGIEDVAYQKALKYFVRQRAIDEEMWLHVVPVRPPAKAKSHIRGLQPIMATGRLYVHPTQHVLRNELAEFPLGEHDDAADALALQLQLMSGMVGEDAIKRSMDRIEEVVKNLLRPRQATRSEQIEAGIGPLWSSPLPEGSVDDLDDWSRERFLNWDETVIEERRVA